MYDDLVSVKYQITLPDGLALQLKRAAQKRKVPLARLIRETMEQQLRATKSKPGGRSRHPLAAIIGLMDGEDRDLASRVDQILYR